MNAPPLLDAADALLRGGRQRLRVLVVAAAPLLEQQPLHLRREWQFLRRELADGALPASLVRLLPPTRETLVRTLDRAAAAYVSPHVLHFAGHGEADHLRFETALGELSRYGNDALADDLRGKGIRLAVLNACETAPEASVSLARFLVTSGATDAAIGHTTRVADDAALLFASRLYRGLCQGERLRDAFEAAEEALAAQFPNAAKCTNLFGDGTLHFGPPGAGAPSEAFCFDGTSDRGRMPEVPHFFGRVEELVAIGRFFEATDKRVLTLSGLGGIGKTALALEAASRHAWRFPGGLAFASARAQALGAPTAESLLRPMMASLALPPVAPEQIVEALFHHLQEHPGLLVFDQLDELAPAELERLVRILEQLPLNGSKALLTLRTAPQILREGSWLQPITLAVGLSARAGSAYVAHAAQGKVPELADKESSGGAYAGLSLRLARALSGHPKLLDIAVSLAATHGVRALERAVTELSRPDAATASGPFAETLEARMEAFLESASSLLDADGKWVLSFFQASPDGTFTRNELQAAARAAERAAGRAVPPPARFTLGLDACVKAGLLEHEREPELYRLHPTVRWYLSRRGRDPGAAVLLGLIDHCTAFVSTHLRDHATLEWRLSFMMAVFERAWSEEVPHTIREQVLSAVDRMGPFFLARAGSWPEMPLWMKRLEERHGEPLSVRAERLYRKGVLLFDEGHIGEAKQCLQESADLHRRLGLLPGHLAALAHLGMVGMAEGQFEETRRFARESLELLRTFDSPADEAFALHLLACVEHRNGDFRKVRDLSLKALDKLKGTDQRQKEVRALVLMVLGISTAIMGDPEEGNRFIAESASLLHVLGSEVSNSILFQTLAQREAANGRLPEAHSFLSQAAAIADSHGSPYRRAIVLMQQATYERQQGLLQEALKSLEDAWDLLDLLGKEKHPNERAMLLNERASIYLIQRKDSSAQQELDKALKLEQRVGDDLNRAATLRFLSEVEYFRRNYSQARSYAEESLALFASRGNHLSQADALYQLAQIDAKEGHDARAERHLKESLRLMEMHGRHLGRADPLVILAQVEERLGRVDEARTHIQEALTLMEKTGHPQLPIARSVLLGLTMRSIQAASQAPLPKWMEKLSADTEKAIRAGHPEKALDKIRAATATHAGPDRPVTLAMLLSYEAQLLELAGRPREAREVLERALAIAETAGQRDQAEALRRLLQHIESLCGQTDAPAS